MNISFLSSPPSSFAPSRRFILFFVMRESLDEEEAEQQEKEEGSYCSCSSSKPPLPLCSSSPPPPSWTPSQSIDRSDWSPSFWLCWSTHTVRLAEGPGGFRGSWGLDLTCSRGGLIIVFFHRHKYFNHNMLLMDLRRNWRTTTRQFKMLNWGENWIVRSRTNELTDSTRPEVDKLSCVSVWTSAHWTNRRPGRKRPKNEVVEQVYGINIQSNK